MSKKVIYLDIDDTLKDTELYLRRVLGIYKKDFKKYGLDEDGGVYGLQNSKRYQPIFDKALSDYTKIPYVVGALDGLNILRTKYDVILCSSCHSNAEVVGKKLLAEELGMPILLCTGDKWKKSSINMSGAILVDDSISQLEWSNAERKICMYKEGFWKENPYETAFSWGDLLDMLM